MLAPRDRTLLLESLRPPLGYRLDQAVGTSYSLDLLALLTAPLAFTFFDWEDEDGRPSADPLALLEAVRRHAGRIHLFCQAGAIHAPQDGHLLFTKLEPCVHEVAAPRGGVFHPKLWVLRYLGAEEEPVRYRVVVLSRNLTFDQSWDTVLVLDGKLGKGKRTKAVMRPLADMIGALPGLAVRPVNEACQAATDLVASELGRVELELPQGFRELRFHPLGMNSRRDPWLFDFGWRRLAISPFLSNGFLERFAGDSEDRILISRPESLLELSESVRKLYADCYTLAQEADAEAGEEDRGAGDAMIEMQDRLDGVPSGLHAKLFLVENGHHAHVFTGSANATEAAFSRNVEILVELVGGKWKQGIPALLESEETGTLRDLLEEWTQPEEEFVDPDAVIAARLDHVLDKARRALAGAQLELQADPVDSVEGFDLTLLGRLPRVEGVGSARLWPVSLSPADAWEWDAGSGASLPGQELARFRTTTASLTAFISLELTARDENVERRTKFSLCLPLVGAPVDREQRILRALLRDKDTVLRLLYLLLSCEEMSVEDFAGASGRSWRKGHAGGSLGLPLLEAMVRALDRNPSSLEPIHRLVEDLRSSELGRSMLPDGFEELWEPVRTLAARLTR